MPTAEHVDQSLLGAWIMERDETFRLQKNALKEAGIIKVNQDEFDFKRNFSSMHSNLDLESDAEWTCSMGDFASSGEFSGYWKTDGKNISVVQTHEERKPKRDIMTGTYDETFLYLNHNQNDIKMPFVFRRMGAAKIRPESRFNY